MEYKTGQKLELLKFLKLNSDKSFTIDEICNNITVGKSTVYRLIHKMVEDGMVRRFSDGKSRQAAFQYIDCEKCLSHLHMKCVECGKILHMKHNVSEAILDDIRDDNDFLVDSNKTIIFGKCANCNKERK